MPSNFPTNLDTFAAKKVIDLEDALEAVEAKLGVNGSADAASVDKKLATAIADVATKAADDAVVKLTGDQTIDGIKNWSQRVRFRKRPWASAQHPDFGAVPGGAAATNNTALQAWLDACKAEDLWGFLDPDPLPYDVSTTLELKQKWGWRLSGGGFGTKFGTRSTLKWAGTAGLMCPARPTLTVNAGAGTMAAGYYKYRVSATNATGATMPGAEQTATVATNGAVTVTWTAVTGATGYRVWRGVYTPGVDNELLLATVGAVTTYTDDGSVTPSGAMPTAYSAGGGTLLLLQGVARGLLEHIGFEGDSKAACLIDYDAVSSGLVSTLNAFEHVRLEDCVERALRIGKSNFQTDQTEYDNVGIRGSYIGVSLEDANAVWHAFSKCVWQSNDIGITGQYAGTGGHFSLSHARFVTNRQWDMQTFASRTHTLTDVNSEGSNRFIRGSRSGASSGHPIVIVGGGVNSLTCPPESAGGRVGIEWTNPSPLVLIGFSGRGDSADDATKNFCILAGANSTRRATVSTLGCTFDGNPFRTTSAAYTMAALPGGMVTKRISATADAHFLGNPLPYLTPTTAAAVSTTAAAAAAAVGSRWAELAWAKVPSGTALVAGANLFYWRSNNAVGLCRVEIPTIKSFGGADAVLLGIDGSDNNASTALTVVLNVRCSAAFTLTSDLVFAIRFAPEPLTSG